MKGGEKASLLLWAYREREKSRQGKRMECIKGDMIERKLIFTASRDGNDEKGFVFHALLDFSFRESSEPLLCRTV